MALAGVFVWLSNSVAFICAGSDSTAHIIGPSPAGQTAAMIGMAAAAAAGFFMRGARRRGIGFGIYAVLLLLATHRIDIDAGRGAITDHWLAVTVQTLPINAADGPAADGTKLRRYWLFDEAVPVSGPRLVALRGVFPLTIDLGQFEQAWN